MPKAELAQIVTRATPLHENAVRYSPLETELLFGEIVEILAKDGEWSRIRNARDSYEGYIHSSALSYEVLQPTHKVNRLHTLVYTTPNFKTSPLTHLPFMALVTLTDDVQNGFVKLSGGSWVWEKDLTDLAVIESDYVSTAERFIDVPYLWGGRTDRGLDCSALVQLALTNAGIECPRNSGEQMNHFDNDVDFGAPENPENLQRGDVVFLEHHVGFMIDAHNFLNATSRTMDVRVENLQSITEGYTGGVLAAKRIS